MVLEQLPPTYAWGKQFLISSFSANLTNLPVSACVANNNNMDARFKQRGDLVQVVADHDFTTLAYNGQQLGAELAAGQTYSFVLPEATAAYLTASKPVLVMQLMMSQDARLDGTTSMTGGFKLQGSSACQQWAAWRPDNHANLLSQATVAPVQPQQHWPIAGQAGSHLMRASRLLLSHQ
jgi:hypothetical protein